MTDHEKRLERLREQARKFGLSISRFGEPWRYTLHRDMLEESRRKGVGPASEVVIGTFGLSLRELGIFLNLLAEAAARAKEPAE